MLLLLGLFIAASAWTDSAEVQPAPGGTVAPVENKSIRLVDETVDIFLKDYEAYHVEVEYHFENTGAAQSIVMGFPDQVLLPLANFQATEGGKKLEVVPKKGRDADTAAADGGLMWQTFTMSFAEKEKKTIQNGYDAKVSRSKTNHRIKYILTTGALWKDKINEVLIRVHFDRRSLVHPDFWPLLKAYWQTSQARGEDYGGFSAGPSPYTVKNDVMEMRLSNIKPGKDFELSFPGPFIDAKASSFLTEGKVSYPGQNAIDMDPSTAWAVRTGSSGIGESLAVDVAPISGYFAGSLKVSQLRIVNGYAQNDDLFRKNNRVKKIRIESSYYEGDTPKVDNPPVVLELADTREPQILAFPRPLFISKFTITILEVYKGSRYDDTCLAEVGVVTMN
jgi:hypothetical protein